jgi:hypothetical protein
VPDRRQMPAGVALAAVIAVACSPTVSPSPSATAGPLGTSSPSLTAIDVTCEPDATPAPALQGDPCPGATTAVELAVAPVRLPIERIAIEAGPFFCDVIWPGARSSPPCFGPAVIPGQYMHAWVSFIQSEKVAAVALGRNLPADLSVPATAPLPWNATLVTVEVPPAGWAMP